MKSTKLAALALTGVAALTLGACGTHHDAPSIPANSNPVATSDATSFMPNALKSNPKSIDPALSKLTQDSSSKDYTEYSATKTDGAKSQVSGLTVTDSKITPDSIKSYDAWTKFHAGTFKSVDPGANYTWAYVGEEGGDSGSYYPLVGFIRLAKSGQAVKCQYQLPLEKSADAAVASATAILPKVQSYCEGLVD